MDFGGRGREENIRKRIDEEEEDNIYIISSNAGDINVGSNAKDKQRCGEVNETV